MDDASTTLLRNLPGGRSPRGASTRPRGNAADVMRRNSSRPRERSAHSASVSDSTRSGRASGSQSSRDAGSTSSGKSDHRDARELEKMRQAKEISYNQLTKVQRTPRFRRFINSDRSDSFAYDACDYLRALFAEIECDHDTPSSTGQYELELRLKRLAMSYAAILLKEGGGYSNGHNENVFFETLYMFLITTLHTRFDRSRWPDIEVEMGRLFRSHSFNMSARSEQDVCSSRELYAKRLNRRNTLFSGSVRQRDAAGGKSSYMHGLIAREGQSPMITNVFRVPTLSKARSARRMLPGLRAGDEDNATSVGGDAGALLPCRIQAQNPSSTARVPEAPSAAKSRGMRYRPMHGRKLVTMVSTRQMTRPMTIVPHGRRTHAPILKRSRLTNGNDLRLGLVPGVRSPR